MPEEQVKLDSYKEDMFNIEYYLQEKLRQENEYSKHPTGTDDINIIISIFNEKFEKKEQVNIEDIDSPDVLTEALLSIISNKNFDPKSLFERDAEINPNILAIIRAFQAEQSRQQRKNMSPEEKSEAHVKSLERQRKRRAQMSPKDAAAERAKKAEWMRRKRQEQKSLKK